MLALDLATVGPPEVPTPLRMLLPGGVRCAADQRLCAPGRGATVGTLRVILHPPTE